MNSRLLFGIAGGFLCVPFIAAIAQAQITPDGTLNTTVTQSGLNTTITNGTAAGTNLYHSFGQFSVPTVGSATFDLNATPSIRTIFSRVTGGSVSNIDGLIRTLNSSNPVSLFLMNPAGIIFGANASLNIGGSFVATTANSIKFADGAEFSAINPQAAPLLSINLPLGLQMGSNPAAITVQGTGHALNNSGGLLLVTLTPSTTELRVQPGNTLALVGGNLELNGATLTAKQGQIELGSVSSAGLVRLLPTALGYRLGYETGQRFGEIQLTQRSLLDVSGVNAGSVQVQGRHIQFTEGSLILARNFGSLPGGDILLQATEAIDLIGATPNGSIRSGVRSEAVGRGVSGDISVSVPHLAIQQGGALISTAFGVASGGKIHTDAIAMEIDGLFPANPNSNSVVVTSTYGSGNAGAIAVNANRLLVANGASLTSATFGSGSSGTVAIRTDATTVSGDSPAGLYSTISSVTFATGSAKTLTLDTARLQILNGGAVAATTFFAGNGGDIRINATESIEISGRSPSNNSSINSSSTRLAPQLRQRFGLPDRLTANAGNVSIATPSLTVTDGGTVSVTSQGSGDGGSLNITANTIQLDRQGSIQAQTESGNGGNITLQVGSLLLLRRNSTIAATAGGNGDGGNITINAPIIAGFENSDIIANAVRGRGGNIQITTQGIFGLKFRPQLTLENDITASSQFGVSGTVQINNFGIDPDAGIVQLPTSLVDPSQQIATGCNAQGSHFVATGRGGLPRNPNESVGSDRPWSDIRDVSQFQQPGQSVSHIPHPAPRTPQPAIIEATALIRSTTGGIELIASPGSGNTEIGDALVTCVPAKP